MELCLSTFEVQDCVVANSIELIDSARDSHIFTKTKDFTFLLLTSSRHFLVHFHMVQQSPCCHLDSARKDFLALVTTRVAAIFTFFALLNVSG